MSWNFVDSNRRMIPRWRDSIVTIRLGELDGLPDEVSLGEINDEFHKIKLLEWEYDKSIGIAADLVASALLVGDYTESLGAAEFLLKSDVSATDAVKSIANTIILQGQNDQGPESEVIESNIDADVELIRAKARLIKRRLDFNPRNSLLRVDLARQYVLQGQNAHAIAEMDTAVRLTPFSRFVLRSASRLFIHLDQPDRAYRLLSTNPRTMEDPWLLSAEIAAAAVAGERIRKQQLAMRIVDSKKFSSFHLSELASSIATVELTSGSRRRSRAFFEKALVDPTDNSVAQAEWASPVLGTLEISDEIFRLPRTYEANAWKEFRKQNWLESINNTRHWFSDEPFSSRPAIFGSYTASVAMENYVLGEKFARQGLIANPNDSLLINNLSFSLANQGKLIEAQEELDKITPINLNSETKVAILATQGLIYFMNGYIERGRSYYLDAIGLATENSLTRSQAIATLYLIREEIRSNTPISQIEGLVSAVRKIVDEQDDLEIKLLASRVFGNLRTTYNNPG